MQRAWLWLSLALKRIQRDKLYTRVQCETWTKYLESELSGLSQGTINQMSQARVYIEENEPGLVEMVRAGPSNAEDSSFPDARKCVPSYDAVERLKNLKSNAKAGVVEQDDYDELHEQAFTGEISGKEVRRQVHKLSKGAQQGRRRATGAPKQPVQCCHLSIRFRHLQRSLALTAGLREAILCLPVGTDCRAARSHPGAGGPPGPPGRDSR